MSLCENYFRSTLPTLLWTNDVSRIAFFHATIQLKYSVIVALTRNSYVAPGKFLNSSCHSVLVCKMVKVVAEIK